MRLATPDAASQAPSSLEPDPCHGSPAKTEFPAGIGVHALFERQVLSSAESVAVATAAESLTYGELNARANRLAHHLRSMGVKPGVCVGLLLDRSPSMVVGVLAVLKAGGAYLPLDSLYPESRVQHMLGDSGASIVVTLSSLMKHLPDHSARIVCLDRDADSINEGDSANPAPLAGDRDLACVIYTSGSTGKPKGVEIEHGGVVNYLTSVNRIIGINARDIFMAVTTLAFDICGFDLFSPLSVGGKVLLVDRETASDGIRLRQRLEQSDATVLQATPATWRLLLEAGWEGEVKQSATRQTSQKGGIQAIRILSGGEAMDRKLADRLLARGREVWNLYGPTETTVYSTWHRVNEGQGPVSIGRPLANTSLYVLDEHFQPVAAGEIGELYIGGAGVARGYRNRPELTAERFLADPFSPAHGARMYRTGDMVRFRDDGTLDFLGRADHQVKIRGFRIELGEIEANLLNLPGVRAAAVVAQNTDNGSPRLLAFVVAEPGREMTPATLRQGLRGALPEYMLPAGFVLLDALPMTPNAKIDRKALAMHHWDQLAAGLYVPPVEGVEKQVAEIFCAVLKVPRVGATDSFFEFGGDSLNAVSLAVHIRDAFNKTITLADIFHAPTVAALARLVQDEPSLDRSALVPLRKAGHRPPLFCLPGSGGSSLNFRDLARRLPNDLPVYGYNLPYAEQGRQSFTTIREYAIHLLKHMRAVHPGPYNLVGYSFGGAVAFEMAQMLAEQGEPVNFLGLIDAWAFGFPYKPPLIRRMIAHGMHVIQAAPEKRYWYLRARFKSMRQRISRKAKENLRGLGFGQHKQQSIQQMLDDVRVAAEFALSKYVPRPYSGNVSLYRASLQPDNWPTCSFEDSYNGWRPFVRGELKLTVIPCGHWEVFDEPSLDLMAANIAEELQSDAAPVQAINPAMGLR